MGETSEIQGGLTHTRFVHAANNLGWLQIRNGNYLEAIATFETAERECSPPSVLRACAYVWYNRGDAEAWLHNYAKAERQFELAIERITGRAIDNTDRMLEAQLHQYLAFTLVRQAAFALGMDKNKLLARAAEAWQRGVEFYENSSLSMPEHHGITLARIHIERGEWQPAIDLLLSLDVPELRITVESLLAAIYACTGQTDRQFSSITAMTMATDVQTPIEEAWEEMARIEANCK
jgi:tetratricopeptide (TPR) repeat protein